MAILIIPVEGKPYKSLDFVGEPELKWLQKQVAGYIEIINLSLAGNIQMIVDEEGLIKEKRVNLVGTLIHNLVFTTSQLIVGDVIILTEGNTCK